MSKEIENLLSNLKAPTLLYSLRKTRNISPYIGSYIGGIPYSEKNSRIPICRTCKKPMNFVFQLNIPSNDKRSNLHAFYYCFSCLPLKGKNGFKMVRYDDPSLQKMVKKNSWTSPINFSEFVFTPQWSLPEWNSLPFVDINVQTHFLSTYEEQAEVEYENLKDTILNSWNFDSFSFYGGYANFLGFPAYPKCNHCDETMELFMQLDSNEEKGMTWNEYGCLHIFRCSTAPNNFEILIQ